MPSGHPRALARWLLAAAVLGAAATGHAGPVDEINKKLIKLDAEAQNLSQGVKRPSGGVKKDDVMARRLIDAQVEFGTGNYEGAALLLYDYVSQPKKGPDHDTALYYLGESLFQKGDRVAARTYFTELVQDHGKRSKFYQQSLQRLLELSLILRDSADVDAWLAALDAVPEAERKDSVPYVRGKYAFSLEKYDEAEQFFRQVKPESEYGFQAQYYLGTTLTAKKDLGSATKVFAALIKREAKTDDEQRVVDLAQMALGRLYYERDQPTKAIDSYLLVDRKSDLFDEVLYEVAWVYIKAKQFDKALRALELLALADPTSSKMPTVKILEGNLRIRKAKQLKGDMVLGVDQGKGNPTEEYLKADRVFSDTKGTFKPPHDELTAIIDSQRDPREFMVQITGRVSHTFETNATMPEIAAAWIREEPDVQRVVMIETDLGDIQTNIAEAEQTIDRLDAALSSANRYNVFPSLAEKRNRATEIFEELFEMSGQLASHGRNVARKHASGSELSQLDELQARRKRIRQQLADLPNSGIAYSQRVEQARGEFDELDRQASEIQTVIDTTQATMVALRKYINEVDPPPAPEMKTRAETELRELETEMAILRDELNEVRREALLGRDAAGTGDEVAERERELRAELRAAYQAEHKLLGTISGRASGGDRDTAGKVQQAVTQIDGIYGRLDKMNTTIEQIVESALVEVRDTLTREKADLASYRREFLLYEAESRELGGTVLGSAFRDVKTKFYDVVVRSDVGVVDVSWSQTEDATEDLRRLELDRKRELDLLRNEFRDLLDEEEADNAPPAPPEEGGEAEGDDAATDGGTP